MGMSVLDSLKKTLLAMRIICCLDLIDVKSP